MEYTLIRSKRKTIGIYIKGTMVEVHAPMSTAKNYIDDFIETKRGWIEKYLAIERAKNREKIQFVINATIPYKGIECKIVGSDKVAFVDNNFYVLENSSKEQVSKSVITLYKILAKREFLKQVQKFAPIMGVMPTAIKISSAKGHWGSCSGKNSLNFTWRLMFGNNDVIEYVVVHELAHIKQHNHSAAFWEIVEKILPDYKDRKKQLVTLQEWLDRVEFF